MKIQRFTEAVGDDFTYKGKIIINFDILKSKIESYSTIFSDKEVKKLGIDGILQKFIFVSLDPSFLPDNFNSFKEFEKTIDYDLYDKDGSLIGKDAFDTSNKFNI